MPRLQPPGLGGYWPAHSSPLGLYVYTAADLEVEAAFDEGVAAVIDAEEEEGDRGAVDWVFGFDDEEGVASALADVKEGEAVESPRKRRRIKVMREGGSESDVELTIDYARRATAHSALVGRVDHASGSTSVPRSMTDAGWSFRPLDEETTMDNGFEQRASPVEEAYDGAEHRNEGDTQDEAIDLQRYNTSAALPSVTGHRDRVTRAAEPPQIRQPPTIGASSPSPPAPDNRVPAPRSDSRSEAIVHTATDIQRTSRSNAHEQHKTSNSPRPGSQSELLALVQTSPTRRTALSGLVEAGSL